MKSRCYCGLALVPGQRCLHGGPPEAQPEQLRRLRSTLRKREARANSARNHEFVEKSEIRAAWSPPVGAFPKFGRK